MHKKKGGTVLSNGKEASIFVTIVSVYVHTFKATVEMTEKFFSDFQSTSDRVNENDAVLVVGDFNARVGSSEKASIDLAWSGVSMELEKMNEAAEERLSLCTLK